MVVEPLVGFFSECLVILLALLGGALDDGLDLPMMLMMCNVAVLTLICFGRVAFMSGW